MEPTVNSIMAALAPSGTGGAGQKPLLDQVTY